MRDRLRALWSFNVLVPALAVVLTTLAVSWKLGLFVLVGSLVLGAVAAWPERIREYGFELAIIVLLGFAIPLQGQYGERDFYAASAQLIPVLFVAMAVGNRLSLVGLEESDRRNRLTTIFALVLGEALSLQVLATHSASSGAFGFVVGSLAAASVGLLSDIVGRPPNQGERGE
jgi:uncharacterized membrane protein